MTITIKRSEYMAEPMRWNLQLDTEDVVVVDDETGERSMVLSAPRMADEDDSEATRLTWTTDRPTQPGWYWARSHDTPAIVEVFRRGNGELRDRVGPLDIPDDYTEWAGPIPDPEEPTP